MENILLIFVLLTMAIIFAYILYTNGFLVYKAKAALFYKGSVPFGKTKNCMKAKFSSCNGMTKRVICLEKGKKYQFTFSKSMTKGTVYVEIQGNKGEIILKLDDETPTATIVVEEGKRYHAVTKFVKADGEYILCWDTK
ncbi:MAG: hypothetical protein Q4E73_03665 [Lachnospiraceae bacterium]|nr:hypothetical protein [Lachnospiraceae bacterium]